MSQKNYTLLVNGASGLFVSIGRTNVKSGNSANLSYQEYKKDYD